MRPEPMPPPLFPDPSGLPALVTERIFEVLGARDGAFARQGPDAALLWQATSESLQGGKLLRPILLLQMVEALHTGPEAAESERAALRSAALDCAAAVEMLHAAFLLHDDVIDHDTTRRGRTNLIGVLAEAAGSDAAAAAPDGHEDRDPGAALHWARSAAILAGDLLIAQAHGMIARIDLPRQVRLDLLAHLEDAIEETAIGEHLDVGLGAGVLAPTTQTIARMTRLKTAAYTLELPLRLAAALTAASPEAQAVLRGAGGRLGFAFQLQDDALSLFGDVQEHGKDPDSDLREGKQTALIAHARSTSAWELIAPRFGAADLTPAEGEELRGLLQASGAQDRVQELIADEIAAVRALLASGPEGLPPAAVQVLLDLISRLDGRTR